MQVSSTLPTRPTKTKGKDAELERWEAEIRKNKNQAALLEKQLAMEAEIRARVNATQKQMERGLGLIKSVIEAGVVGAISVLGGQGGYTTGEGVSVSDVAVLLLDVVGNRLIQRFAADVYCVSDLVSIVSCWLTRL